MNSREAIMAYSQSEKIKAGIIWASQLVQLMDGFTQTEKQGAGRMIKALVGMVSNEVQLAGNIAGKEGWEGIAKDMDQAMVMIHSGVVTESVFHMTQALSKVTNAAGRAMTELTKKGLL